MITELTTSTTYFQTYIFSKINYNNICKDILFLTTPYLFPLSLTQPEKRYSASIVFSFLFSIVLQSMLRRSLLHSCYLACHTTVRSKSVTIQTTAANKTGSTYSPLQLLFGSASHNTAEDCREGKK